jgi:hypothetical protein
VAYSGSWEDPPLPAAVPGVAFTYAEGCEEIDGQLYALSSRPEVGPSRAIWLGVGVPEARGFIDGSDEAEVRVFTSTGLDDLAAYACRVRRDGAAWSAERCELEAVG